MGKKSTPKAPKAPDPVAVANAQAEANTKSAITQAGLNRINQVTPEGTLSYTQDGTWEDGTPRYTQTTTLSPEQQALYDQQNQVAQALGGLAGSNISRVQQAQATPFSYDGMTPLKTVNAADNLSRGATAPTLQTGFDTVGGVQRGFDQGGQVRTSFDTGEEYGDTARAAMDAVYAQAASRLDPQYAQRDSELAAKLANSGVSVGSNAWRTAMDQLGRERTDAYNQANYSSIGAGLAAQQQGFGQNLARGQFYNSAIGQQYQQNLGQAQFVNDAQQQQYAQNLGAAEFGNSAAANNFQLAQQAAGFRNQAEAQNFNQQSAAAAQNNQVRQQEIEEAAYLRNMPLNDIAALLGTGGGVQQPNFGDFAQVGVAAPDYQGAVYANYNAANQQYQQALQARSQGLGSIFGLAGSLGSAAIMASDRRVKENVKRIGTLASGLATYAFNYIGSAARQFGVMAQEALNVIPEAVVERDGILYVDYRKVR